MRFSSNPLQKCYSKAGEVGGAGLKDLTPSPELSPSRSYRSKPLWPSQFDPLPPLGPLESGHSMNYRGRAGRLVSAMFNSVERRLEISQSLATRFSRLFTACFVAFLARCARFCIDI
jgi:hypothetical protein